MAPNDVYIHRTAQLTSRRHILNIYSTNILTEYFKHAAHSPFFTLQDAVYFIMLSFFGSCNIHILNTGVLKFKRKFRRQRVNMTCFCYICKNITKYYTIYIYTMHLGKYLIHLYFMHFTMYNDTVVIYVKA